ncbi:MAG: hypothetical protein Q9166_002791 [cf. Caloplaca sp. 2 TL-2023]
MAAGKGRSLKLKIDIRAKLNVEPKSKKNIKNPAMASASDQTPPSPMENAPEPTSPFHYTGIGPLQSQQPMSRASASLAAARRRRSSKGSISSSLKRSASTPNVRGLVTAESGMSLVDKRRNKLGYHRTSVACGRSYPIHGREQHVLLRAQVTADDARYDVCSPWMIPRIVVRTASG